MLRFGYQFQYIASWVVLIAGLAIGAIKLADAGALGLTPQTAAWLAVVGMVVQGLQSVLPKVTKPPSDDRVGQD